MLPEEALAGPSENAEEQMERASSTFYDLVLSQYPEFLSPQFNSFFDAAQNPAQTKDSNVLSDAHNEISLATLSEILIGLSEQVQSVRRDVHDKDYPNEHYERLLHHEERALGSIISTQEGTTHGHQYATPFVRMETSYLNNWTEFE